MNVKDDVKWLEKSTFGAPRYVILLYFLMIILMATLILVGFHIIGKYEIREGYELFRDILAVVLTIAGIAIAVLGYGIYESVLKHAENIIKEKKKEFISFSTALLFLNMGYFHWQHYKIDYKSEKSPSELLIKTNFFLWFYNFWSNRHKWSDSLQEFRYHYLTSILEFESFLLC